MRLRIIAVSGAAASVDRFDRTVAPAKAPTAPGTARRRTTFQSTLPKRQWEMPEASVVPSSAVWTTALAWAGPRPASAMRMVVEVTPKPMPRPPSTSCAASPARAMSRSVVMVGS